MRTNFVFAFLLISYGLSAQTKEEDDVKFKAAVDWLDSKLNYVYYDDVGEKWWNNTFYVNEKREVTIKHIASSKPNTGYIKQKDYTIRSFRIQDINPNSLKISEIEETKGRLVKGKMLELRTFGFQDLIHKTINKRRGSSTSFLFLSFPEVLNDTLNNYAQVVKEKFEEAILASTRIYPTGDERDIETIFSVLTGSFQSLEGKEWKSELVQPNLLKIDLGTSGPITYFGFDQSKKQCYILKISSEGFIPIFLEIDADQKLSLYSDGNKTFQLLTMNSFIYEGQEFVRQ